MCVGVYAWMGEQLRALWVGEVVCRLWRLVIVERTVSRQILPKHIARAQVFVRHPTNQAGQDRRGLLENLAHTSGYRQGDQMVGSDWLRQLSANEMLFQLVPSAPPPVMQASGTRLHVPSLPARGMC